jgi:hypothetical protein
LEFFHKYLHIPRNNHICANDSDPTHSFVFNCSINAAREQAKEFASKMTFKRVLLHDDITPAENKPHLPGVLDKRASLALMCMSHLEESNRMNNDTFSICLKRKLRLKLFTRPQTKHANVLNKWMSMATTA